MPNAVQMRRRGAEVRVAPGGLRWRGPRAPHAENVRALPIVARLLGLQIAARVLEDELAQHVVDLAQPRGGGRELPVASTAAATRPGDTGGRGQAAARASAAHASPPRSLGRANCSTPDSLGVAQRKGPDILIDADRRPWQIQLHLWPIALGPWDPAKRSQRARVPEH